MVEIDRGDGPVTDETYRINLNIVLSGSKRMSPEAQAEAMKYERIHICISSEDDKTLVDTWLPAKAFKTGSVGYGLQQVAAFEPTE